MLLQKNRLTAIPLSPSSQRHNQHRRQDSLQHFKMSSIRYRRFLMASLPIVRELTGENLTAVDALNQQIDQSRKQ